jgi:hypothetical protein
LPTFATAVKAWSIAVQLLVNCRSFFAFKSGQPAYRRQTILKKNRNRQMRATIINHGSKKETQSPSRSSHGSPETRPMPRTSILLGCFVGYAMGHGSMLKPRARNSVDFLVNVNDRETRW